MSETSRNNVFYLTFKDFHPRMTKALLTKCLKFAEEKDHIMQEIFYYLMEIRGWKKDGLFDVTMGTYDDTELCWVVGTFFLN